MIRSGEIKNIFKNLFGESVSFDTPMKSYTTFGVGGPADVFLKVSSEKEAVEAMELSKRLNLPIFFLGGGSNILVGDGGIRGLVVKNEIVSIEREGSSLTSGSGVSLDRLIAFAKDGGLSGLEFMSGIYGTVGGAVSGNAGAYGHSICEFVDSIDIINDRGGKRRVSKNEMKASYRHLKIEGLNPSEIFFISSARLILKKGEKVDVESEMKRVLAERDSKMQNPLPSAGCFFKNVEKNDCCYGKLSAGKLLEEIGAKGMGDERVGVHGGHANIIMNRGGATAADILAFARKLQKLVEEKRGVKLEFEVRLVGEF